MGLPPCCAACSGMRCSAEAACSLSPGALARRGPAEGVLLLRLLRRAPGQHLPFTFPGTWQRYQRWHVARPCSILTAPVRGTEGFSLHAQHVEEMDGAKFAKLCRDTKLLSRSFTPTDVDLFFAKVRIAGRPLLARWLAGPAACKGSY